MSYISGGQYLGLYNRLPCFKYDFISQGLTSLYGYEPRVSNSHTSTPYDH